MAGLNWKNEAAANSALRMWQGLREHYQAEGAAAADGAQCPYAPTSFAAIHWRRGLQERSEG